MTAWLVPHIIWCLHGTVISPRDLISSISKPLFSAVFAAGISVSVVLYLGVNLSHLWRLVLAGGIMIIVYLSMLLLVLKQNTLYLDLIRGLRSSPSPD